MGSWRKVGAFLGLVPDDSRGYDGEYDAHHDYEDDFEPGYRRRSPDYEHPMTNGALAMQPPVELRRERERESESAAAIRPVTVKLTGFGEARIVGEKFRDRQSVILDMTEMDDSDARRLVDFAAGLAFALRGSIDKVTTKVFMLLPPADIAGVDGTRFDEHTRDAVLADARRLAGAAR